MITAISSPACQAICNEEMKTPSALIHVIYDVQKGAVVFGGLHVLTGLYEIAASAKNTLIEAGCFKNRTITVNSDHKIVLKVKDFASLRLWNGFLHLKYGTTFLTLGLMDLGLLNWNYQLRDNCQYFCEQLVQPKCHRECLHAFNPTDTLVPTLQQVIAVNLGAALIVDSLVKTTIGLMGSQDENFKPGDPERTGTSEFLRKRRWSPKIVLLEGALSICSAGAVLAVVFSKQWGSHSSVYGKPQDVRSDSWGVCQTLCGALNVTKLI